jgi:hypothetical protein
LENTDIKKLQIQPNSKEKMNTNSKKNPFKEFMLRTLAFIVMAIGSATSAHAENQVYGGTFSDAPAVFVVIWENSAGLETVYGSISFSGESFTFTGSNPVHGHLILEDQDGNIYRLTKAITAGQVIWSGLFNDNVPVSFSRNL